jgi:hypothetical protein
MTVQPEDTFVADLCDKLGKIKAQIADLQKLEEKCKADLKATGVTEAEGSLFRVTVTSAVRESLDMEAVKEKLSPQFIRAHTKETSYTTIRVTARKGD